jgi:hypothetical protein
MIYNKDAFCVAIYTSQTLHLLCILYLRSSVAVESLGARTLVAAAIGQLGGIVGGGGPECTASRGSGRSRRTRGREKDCNLRHLGVRHHHKGGQGGGRHEHGHGLWGGEHQGGAVGLQGPSGGVHGEV